MDDQFNTLKKYAEIHTKMSADLIVDFNKQINDIPKEHQGLLLDLKARAEVGNITFEEIMSATKNIR